MRYFLAILTLCILGVVLAAQNPKAMLVHGGGGAAGGGGTVTLGATSNIGNDGGGDTGTAVYFPIVTPSGASGYTMNAMHVVNGVSSGNLRTAVYGSTTSGCPSNVGACPGTLVCQSSSTASSSGDQVVTPSSCGTFTASTLYWLATNVDNATYAYARTGAPCPANGWQQQFHALTYGAFPGTASSGNTAQTDCFETYAVLNCVGSCGSTVTNYAVLDYAGGTNGTAVSAANMNSNMHCGSGPWSVTGGGAINLMSFGTTPTQAFLTNALTPCSGSTYTGIAPGLNITRTTGAGDQSPNDLMLYTLPNPTAQVSVGFWLQTDTPQNTSNGLLCDVVTLPGVSGSSITLGLHTTGTQLYYAIERVPTTFYYGAPTPTGTWSGVTNSITVSSGTGIVNGQVVSGTNITAGTKVNSVAGTTIGLDTNTTGSGSATPLLFLSVPTASTSTWYWFTMQFVPGSGTTSHAAVYNTSGTQVGITIDSTGSQADTALGVEIGNGGSCFSSPTQHFYYSGFKIDPSGQTFPILP
jgi:hypothetical protein